MCNDGNNFNEGIEEPYLDFLGYIHSQSPYPYPSSQYYKERREGVMPHMNPLKTHTHKFTIMPIWHFSILVLLDSSPLLFQKWR